MNANLAYFLLSISKYENDSLIYFQNLFLNRQECLRRTSENEEDKAERKFWIDGISDAASLWYSVIILLIQWPKEIYEQRPVPVWWTKTRLFQHSRLSIPRWCIVDVSLSGIPRRPNINGKIIKNCMLSWIPHFEISAKRALKEYRYNSSFSKLVSVILCLDSSFVKVNDFIFNGSLSLWIGFELL